jgi:MerR family copper efflux transcriptional regulator
MQIGELARQSGVSRDTLRYYEKTGLIRSVFRQDNGYRDFPAEAAGRLAFIKKCSRWVSRSAESVRCSTSLTNGGPPAGQSGPRLRKSSRNWTRKSTH